MTNEIIKDVFYVGVNDRTSELFERLWPLPLGISYNSYLIKDKFNVLIDTVEHTHNELFFKSIKDAIGDEPIDYLVINHMEPDHSSSIEELIFHYPEIKIIGNCKTLSMLDGFYSVTDNTVEVKDGDTLCIGENTLSFHITPMVHWPETMMTYILNKRVLFSGDAFGSFGALEGAVVDEDMDIAYF
ncbi:MAG: FprA family A-type flavoprotein, partial [Bacteroidales bacterium]